MERVHRNDLEAGDLNTTWGIEAVHRATASDEQTLAFLKAVSIGILLSSLKGAWDSSDDFNKLFPGYKFTVAERFLRQVWEGKA